MENIKLIESIRSVVIAITRTDKFKIEFMKKATTASTDLERSIIYFPIPSDEVIPQEFTDNDDFLIAFYCGLASHEAGHFVKTFANWQYYRNYILEYVSRVELRKYIINLIEDTRVDNFISLRYRHNFKNYLDVTEGVYMYSLYQDLLRKIKESDNDDELKMFLIVNVPILACHLQDKYVEDVMKVIKKKFKRDKEFIEDLEKILRILKIVKFKSFPQYILRQAKEIEEIILKYVKDDNINKCIRVLVPIFEGGCRKVTLKVKKEIREKYSKGTDKVKYSEESHEIPFPSPDPLTYQNLYNEVRPQIDELLKYIKLSTPVKTKIIKFMKSGRLMSKILARAYAVSKRRKVERIYQQKTWQDKEMKNVKIMLVIDLSSSMNTWETMKVLTIIAEVFGRIADEQFGILVFGDNYMKIKTFKESFVNCKYRIGGLHSLGGTNLGKPLKIAIDLLNRERAQKKIVIVVSDYQLFGDDCPTVRRLILNNKKINFMSLVFGSPNCDSYKLTAFEYIHNITALPRKMAEIWLSMFR